MITLTDGTKTIQLTKDEMETIEVAIRDYRDGAEDINWTKEVQEVNAILTKLCGLNYE